MYKGHYKHPGSTSPGNFSSSTLTQNIQWQFLEYHLWGLRVPWWITYPSDILVRVLSKRVPPSHSWGREGRIPLRSAWPSCGCGNTHVRMPRDPESLYFKAGLRVLAVWNWESSTRQASHLWELNDWQNLPIFALGPCGSPALCVFYTPLALAGRRWGPDSHITRYARYTGNDETKPG